MGFNCFKTKPNHQHRIASYFPPAHTRNSISYLATKKIDPTDLLELSKEEQKKTSKYSDKVARTGECRANIALAVTSSNRNVVVNITLPCARDNAIVAYPIPEKFSQ